MPEKTEESKTIIEIAAEVRALRDNAKGESSDAGALKALGAELDTLFDFFLAAVRELRSGEGDEAATESLVTSEIGGAAAHLSDCYGMRGGALRRLAGESDRDERLRLSGFSYDHGYFFERDPRFGVLNSYNLLQRILVRIVAASANGKCDDLEAVEIHVDPHDEVIRASALGDNTALGSLVEARKSIHKQLHGSDGQENFGGDRGRDRWAMADYAFVCALLEPDDFDVEASWKFFLDACLDHEDQFSPERTAQVLEEMANCFTGVRESVLSLSATRLSEGAAEIAM